jgi:hypothetical protein
MENKDQEKQIKEIQKHLTELKKDYQFIFASDEGKNTLSDLEKRCHYHNTTNVKGDSHESAYLEGHTINCFWWRYSNKLEKFYK